MLEISRDQILYKVFLRVLTGVATTWFNPLKLSSISSFDELSESLTSQFTYNKQQKKTISDLMDTKQRLLKSLKQYLERFMTELSQIEDPNNRIASRIFHDGLSWDQELYETSSESLRTVSKKLLQKQTDAFEQKKSDSERTSSDVQMDAKSVEKIQGHISQPKNLGRNGQTTVPRTIVTVLGSAREVWEI